MIAPLISVIVPTIGRSTLERTLNSIIESKYPNLEVLVCANNISLIPIENRIKNFPKEIQLTSWSREKQFPSVCKNAGIKKAKGRYITFLDDDDTSLDNKFFLLSTLLENNSDIFAFFGQYHVRDCYTNKIKNINCGGNYNVNFDSLLKNNYIASGSIMYRNTKEIYFDENIDFGEDWVMNLRLISKYRFAYTPIPVYCWTQNLKEGYTATLSKKGVDWKKIVEKNRSLAKQKWGKNNEKT